MVEKIDNFENKKAKEIDADDEALKKIRQLKLEGNFGIRTIGKELFYDLHKELFEPVQERFHKKYPDINWDAISDDEFPKDYAQALEEQHKEFYKIISEKDEKEILERAKKLYQLNMDDGGYFRQAYSIAKNFLDKERIEVAAEGLFKKTLQQMRESEYEDERIRAAGDLFSGRFVPEVKRSYEILEEAFEVILKSDWGNKNPDHVYLRIRQYFKDTNQKLPMDKKIFQFVNPFARQGVKKLIAEGRKTDAIRHANDLEKIGFLNLETDSDLFEKLTEKI